MKLIVKILLIVVLIWITQWLYLPWWSLALVTFVITLVIGGNSWSGFFAGFIAVFLLWSIQAWWISDQSEGNLAIQLSGLFRLNSPTYLMLGTGFIGGLVAGFSGLTGHHLRKLLVKS